MQKLVKDNNISFHSKKKKRLLHSFILLLWHYFILKNHLWKTRNIFIHRFPSNIFFFNYMKSISRFLLYFTKKKKKIYTFFQKQVTNVIKSKKKKKHIFFHFKFLKDKKKKKIPNNFFRKDKIFLFFVFFFTFFLEGDRWWIARTFDTGTLQQELHWSSCKLLFLIFLYYFLLLKTF